MATDLETRKSSPKSEAFLQRKFAELGARIQRVDLIAHLLALALAIGSYALFIGILDWVAGNSTATSLAAVRWTSYCTFLGLFAFLLARTVFCFFRRVNPYYVAHQLEQNLPDAKNGLINWLDLHDEDLPSAFQRNLGTHAAEQWQESAAGKIVKKRQNWILLGALGVPVVGLAILLVLGPSAWLASMRRAFVPFDAPAPIARTSLTLRLPETGDVEVNPAQSVAFAAKIEGRVPLANRPDAPKLHWRYQENEDGFTLPLQRDDAGLWTAQLNAGQLRTGFTYKITAGDAETPEHQVRVRARAHVKKFEITYHHRPYRKLPKAAPSVFPNEHAAEPHIHAPRGSEVEMVVRTSRPVKNATVEFLAKNGKKDLPIEMRKNDPQAFVCRFPLEQSGQFRIAYTAADGEQNADRDLYEIDVLDDALPKVILTRPGKDIEIPCNGSFVLAGKATSVFGVRGLTLYVRDIDPNAPKLLPLDYRPGKSFQFDNGTYPGEVGYMEFVALDQLKYGKGTIHLPTPGTVLEYWLEAADGSDYPNLVGNVGRSITYKAKLTVAPKNPKQEEIKRKEARAQKDKHQKGQDDKHGQENKEQSGGSQNSEPSLEQIQKENGATQRTLEGAFPEPQKDRGEAKGADQKNADAKGGQGSGDAPQPKGKQQSMPSDGAGDQKDPGGSGSGESKDSGAKDKASPKEDGPPQGEAKGIDKNGPELPNKDQQTAKSDAPPPSLPAKGGMMNNPAEAKSESKEGPPDSAKAPGQARGDDGVANPKQPKWDEITKNIKKLPEKEPEGDAAGKALADIAKNADDPRKSEIAKDALEKNGRDPSTGKKNPFGSDGKSSGIGDDIKAAAANREFAARIGQMQLDDWQKRITPDLLKKAGMSEADWQRFIKNTQTYNAQVRALNAQIARNALKKMSGQRTNPNAKLIVIESTGTSADAPTSNAGPPPELREGQRILTRP